MKNATSELDVKCRCCWALLQTDFQENGSKHFRWVFKGPGTFESEIRCSSYLANEPPVYRATPSRVYTVISNTYNHANTCNQII